MLAAAQDNFDDPGLVSDCVLSYDGNVWRTAVDHDCDLNNMSFDEATRTLNGG